MDRQQTRVAFPSVVLITNTLLLSLVLGLTTFVIWRLVGREAFQGGIVYAIANRGFLLYGLLIVTWAAVGVVAGRWPWRSHRSSEIALIATLAWLVQGAIVVVFRELLADELRNALLGASVWLIATGVGLQPIAVFLGARVGVKLASRSHRTTATTAPDRVSRS